MSTTGDHEKALQLKERGNYALRNKDYESAIDFYSMALKIERQKEFLSNRSLAYYNCQRYKEALSDADAAINIDSTWWRPHYRRGMVLEAMGNYDEAFSAMIKADELSTEKVGCTKEALRRLAAHFATTKGDDTAAAGAQPPTATVVSSNTGDKTQLMDVRRNEDDGLDEIAPYKASGRDSKPSQATADSKNEDDVDIYIDDDDDENDDDLMDSQPDNTQSQLSQVSSTDGRASQEGSATSASQPDLSALEATMKAFLTEIKNLAPNSGAKRWALSEDSPVSAKRQRTDEDEASKPLAASATSRSEPSADKPRVALSTVEKLWKPYSLFFEQRNLEAFEQHLPYPLEEELVTRLKGISNLMLHNTSLKKSLQLSSPLTPVLRLDGSQGSQELQKMLVHTMCSYAGATLVTLNEDVLSKAMASGDGGPAVASRQDALRHLFAMIQRQPNPTVVFCPDNGGIFLNFKDSFSLLKKLAKKSDSRILIVFGQSDVEEDEDGADLLTPDALGIEGKLVVERDGQRINADFPSKYRQQLVDIIKSDPNLLKLAKAKPGPALMAELAKNPKAVKVIQKGVEEIIMAKVEKRVGGFASSGASAAEDSSKSKSTASTPPPLDGPKAPDASQVEKFEEDYVEVISVQPPSKPSLFALWQKRVREDIESRRQRQNRDLLQTCAKRVGVNVQDMTEQSPDLKQLSAILATSLLRDADAEQVLVEAVRSQLSKDTHPVTTTGSLTLDHAAMIFGLKAVLDIQDDPTKAKHTSEELTSLASNQYEESIASSIVDAADINVSWDDVGGLHDTKELLKETTVYPLKYPELYQEGTAAAAPKGLLLFGSPGTGKTMLAKAVACETGATFLSIDSTTIGNKWYGESEKYAKAVFTLARKLAPCVIFIDEIDSLLSSRDDSEKSTIASVKTTLMREWDGLGTTNDRIIVIGATNRPFALDEAILRRMPRRILVDLPDEEEREAILRVGFRGNRLADDIDLNSFARQLEDYSGSDIRELCREAAVRISHDQARQLESMKAEDITPDMYKLRPITMEDLTKAKDKIRPSVHKDSPVLAKVRDWNEQYGETGKHKQAKPWSAMYT